MLEQEISTEEQIFSIYGQSGNLTTMAYDAFIFTDISDYGIPIKTEGAYALASHLRQHGYSVKVIDNFTRIIEEYSDKLFEYLERKIGDNTKFIGFSTTFSRYFGGPTRMKLDFMIKNPTDKDAIDNLKLLFDRIHLMYPHVKILIGGQGPQTWHLHNIFKDKIDCWIQGLGEDIILKFLENPDKAPPILKDPSATNVDFYNKEPTFHKDDLIFDYEVLPLSFSRGCRFRCRFCTYPLIGRKPTDNYIRSEESIYKELMHNYENFKTTTYLFTDDTFNESTDKLKRVKRAIDKTGLDIKFWAYIRIELLERFPEQITILKDMGLCSVYFGIESLYDPAGKAIGKGLGRERILKTLVKVREVWGEDCRLHGSFIIGLPYETKETATEWTQMLIKRETPLDSISVSGLLLVPTDKPDMFVKHIRLHYSVFELESEKYGYRSLPDGGDLITDDLWYNDHWTKSEATEFAKKVMEDYVKYDPMNLKLNDPNLGRAAQSGMALMNLKLVNPSITWQEIMKPMNPKQNEKFVLDVLTAKNTIINNYVERLFE